MKLFLGLVAILFIFKSDINGAESGLQVTFDLQKFSSVRSSPVSEVSIIASESIVGFGVGSLELYRDGRRVSLGETRLAEQTNGTTFRFERLESANQEDGEYILKIPAANIQDASGNTSNQNAYLKWEVWSTTPRIAITTLPQWITVGEPLQGVAINVDASTHYVASYAYVLGYGWDLKATGRPIDPITRKWSCNVTSSVLDRVATRYAVFLIPKGKGAPFVTESPGLPPLVFTNAVARDTAERNSPREIGFSGRKWTVRGSADLYVRPDYNIFDETENSIFVDSASRLHLKIWKKGESWQSSEVKLAERLGYGTYTVQIEGPHAFDRNVVFSATTWSDDPTDAHNEIDMLELATWGSISTTLNAQYVRQRWDTPGNRERFTIPNDTTHSRHTFTWHPDKLDFKSYTISSNGVATLIHEWTLSAQSEIPEPRDEHFVLSFWLLDPNGPTSGTSQEIVVRSFDFEPLPSSTTFGISNLNPRPDETIDLKVFGASKHSYLLQSSEDLQNWSADKRVYFDTDSSTARVNINRKGKFWRMKRD